MDADRYQRLKKLLFDASQRQGDARKAFLDGECADDAELEGAVEAIVETLALALASYDLSPDDQVHAARALRSAFHGFAHLEAGDGHPRPHDLDDTFEHIIDILHRGIERLAR